MYYASRVRRSLPAEIRFRRVRRIYKLARANSRLPTHSCPYVYLALAHTLAVRSLHPSHAYIMFDFLIRWTTCLATLLLSTSGSELAPIDGPLCSASDLQLVYFFIGLTTLGNTLVFLKLSRFAFSAVFFSLAQARRFACVASQSVKLASASFFQYFCHLYHTMSTFARRLVHSTVSSCVTAVCLTSRLLTIWALVLFFHIATRLVLSAAWTLAGLVWYPIKYQKVIKRLAVESGAGLKRTVVDGFSVSSS